MTTRNHPYRLCLIGLAAALGAMTAAHAQSGTPAGGSSYDMNRSS